MINFAKIWPERVLMTKTKVTKFGHHRVRGFRLAAVSLVIRASEIMQNVVFHVKLKALTFMEAQFAIAFNLQLNMFGFVAT